MDYSIIIPEFSAYAGSIEYNKKVYHHLISQREILHKPIYSNKDIQDFFPSLSYRMMNDWEKKKMITGSRSKEMGWRKFSITDIVELFIITDLRKFGLPIPSIKKVLNDLRMNIIGSSNPKTKELETVEYRNFEYFLILSSIGEKNLLLIDEQHSTLLHNEATIIDLVSADNFYSPYLILPFYAYVRKCYQKLMIDIKLKKSTTIHSLLQNRYQLKETIILDIIENDKFQKIEIIKKNRDHFLITGKSVRSGKFNKKEVLDVIDQKDFQSIEAVKENNQIVTITQEEKFWI